MKNYSSKTRKLQTQNKMEIIQKISTKYSFKAAILLTALLLGLVVIIGIVTQQPVPVWWFAFTPILFRMLKG
ncbi:MAG: putative histidine transporter YuiF (NhaC family) [Spirosomataceae bacterium]|jgi:predicted histidine transporter YuiF (NhaC family)